MKMNKRRTYNRLDPSFYDNYYARQVGAGIPVYHGGELQYGHGLGNLLGGLFRSAIPLLKKGATALGKTALEAGADIVDDVLSGQNVKSSVKKRARQAGRNLGNKAVKVARTSLSQKGGGKVKRKPVRGKKKKVLRKTRTRKNIKRKLSKSAFIRRKFGRGNGLGAPDIFGY